MWISRKEFERLQKEVTELRQESYNRYRLVLDLYSQLKLTITTQIDEQVGVRVVEVAKDRLLVELFNKLKDNLFKDADSSRVQEG